jgi:hypothetical protein
MVKKQYKKPQLGAISIDKEISLIMMTWTDKDNPPPPPGSAAATKNPFEENAFQGNTKDQ